MKHYLKPLTKAFEGTTSGLDGIIDALTRENPTPPDPPEPPIPPVPTEKTKVYYQDGTSREFETTGILTQGDIGENHNNIVAIEINGVTAIADGMFDCSAEEEWQADLLSSVTFGSTVRSIGSSTFVGCPLTSVTIPGNVSTIGESVFNSCQDLESVMLENGVTTIDDNAFYGTSIQTMTIPSTVTSLAQNAFETSGLDSLTFAGRTMAQVRTLIGIPENTESSNDYGNNLYCTDGTITYESDYEYEPDVWGYLYVNYPN